MSGEPPLRLDSWKEIAAYLGRDVSTVIRWEKEKGLPVHRLPGGKRQAIFALPDEIDAWLKGAQTETEPAQATAGQVAALPVVPWWRHWFAPWALLILVLLVLGGLLYRKGIAASRSSANAKTALSASSFSRHDFPLFGAYTVAIADLDGDGHLDLAITSYHQARLFFIKGHGDGTFEKEIPVPVGVRPDGLTIGDFDLDKRLDVAVANRGSNSLSLLFGEGERTFRRQDLTAELDARGVASGDFDGDGRTDLVTTLYGSDSIAVFRQEGGRFSSGEMYPVGKSPYQITVGDFNGDGKLDIAVGNTLELKEDTSAQIPTSLTILLGDGRGRFAQTWKTMVGAGSTGLATGDFNKDGKLDLAVAGFSTDACFVLLGNGDGTFATPLKLPTGTRSLAVATADLDGDGNLDLLVGNSHAGTLSILRGKGDGTFFPKTDLQVGSYPKSIAVADLNGDGRLDIVVTNFLSNSYTIYLSTNP